MFKKIPRDHLIFFGGAFLIFAVIQVLISAGILNDFFIVIILIGGAMAIVSIGLNLIYGFNGQFSLGQWGFYAIGAYCAADITYRWSVNKSADGLIVVLLAGTFSGLAIVLIRHALSKTRGLDALSAFTLYLLAVIVLILIALQISKFLIPPINSLLHALPPNISMELVFVLSIILAGVVAAEVSFMFGLPVLTLGSDYFGIATLGFTVIVNVLLNNSDTMFGFQEMKGARGMIGIPQVTTWFWVFLFLLLVVIFTRNLLHSSYGRAIVSVREDEIAAKAMGIDVAHYKILTFVIGSFMAGIAGGLYAHVNGFLHPNTFNFIASFNPMIIIVFGGLGSISGTLIAAFTWQVVLEGVLRLILPSGFETWRFVVYPILLIVVMLLRPAGIFGGWEMPYLRQILPPLSHKVKSHSTDDSQSANIKKLTPAPDGGISTENPEATK